jgi:hypothetical protein
MSESRISTVISILSISPSYQPKDLKAKLSKFPQFHATKIPLLSGRQIERIRHSAPHAACVSDLFKEVPFQFACDVVLLESIQACRPSDPVIAEFLILAALHTYIAFVIEFECSGDHRAFCPLFAALSNLQFAQLRELCISVLDDLFELLLILWPDFPFQDIFPHVYDYFVLNPGASPTHVAVLPSLFHLCLQSSEYTPAGSAGKLASLVAMLLRSHPGSFTPPTVNMIYEDIHPFLYQLNDFSLMILNELVPFLKPEIVELFIQELPVLFCPLVEKENPVLQVPPAVQCETFEPIANAEVSLCFPPVETFAQGFDLHQNIKSLDLDLSYLRLPAVVGVSDLVLRLIGPGAYLQDIFLTKFAEVLIEHQQSEYYLDYMAALVHFSHEIVFKYMSARISFPDAVFSARFSVLQSPALFAIRFMAIRTLLISGGSFLPVLFTSLVNFPVAFSEVIEICLCQIDELRRIINKKVVRTLRSVGLQLQSQQFKLREINQPLECARISLFRLIYRLLEEDQGISPEFLNDDQFLSFFMSLLFETRLRPFVLDELEKVISRSIPAYVFSPFLLQIIAYLTSEIPNEQAVLCTRDVLTSINKFNDFTKLTPLCNQFAQQLLQFDDSPGSRGLLFEIINFLLPTRAKTHFLALALGASRLP